MTVSLRTWFSSIGFSLCLMRMASVVAAAELPLPDAEARELAQAVLKRLTLDEKVSLCGGCATMYLNAIPAAGIAREWAMTDCSHALKPEHGRREWLYVQGVDDRSTVLPPLSAVAQTWNPQLAALHGQVMGEQARARGKDQVLGPGVNIARTPLCGRNWEYLGEDPLLNARLVVPYVRALQREGVAATVKHFCLNNQELARNRVNAVVDERTLNEIYLPAFEAAICEGGALAVMTSYNRVNGQYLSENAYFQRGILRDRWGFAGMIVTDWGGAHSCVPAALNGGNVEMDQGKGIVHFTDFYHGNRLPLAEAVRAGQVPAATVDEMALHVLWTMAKTGFLSGLQPPGERLTPRHADACVRIGEESIVLAKNDDGVLPLKRSAMRKVVVIGRAADMKQCHLGSSCEAHADYEITALAGLREYLGPQAEVSMLPLGAEASIGGDPDRIDRLQLDTFATESDDAFVRRAWEVVTWDQDLDCYAGGDVVGYIDYPDGRDDRLHVRYQAKVIAPETGSYAIGVKLKGSTRCIQIYVDGQRIVQSNGNDELAQVELVAGRRYEFRIDCFWCRKGSFAFGWKLPSAQMTAEEKLAKLRAADAVIAFTGTTMGNGTAREQEGDDRPDLKTFAGHDEELAKLIAMKLPNFVVVNRSGSPMELPWADACRTLVLQPYLGQEAGRILARTLFGEVNPSGKTALTWPRRYADTPVAQCGDYNRTNVLYRERFYVGYRWYDAKGIRPLFPFGYGRSYTTFGYGDFRYDAARRQASVKVTNTGRVAGKETVQVYVAAKATQVERPVKELKGFAKTRLLAPGESETLTVALDDRAFAYWDVLTHRWRTDPGGYEILFAASAADVLAALPVKVE